MDQQTAGIWLCDLLRLDGARISEGMLAGLPPDQWKTILGLAEWYNILPLVYRQLRVLGLAACVPVHVWRAAETAYRRNAARSTMVSYELSRVLAALEKDGIPAIVLKGAHLANAIYGNSALRTMADVDLLVHWADLPRAAERFRAMGYTPAEERESGLPDALYHALPPFNKQDAPPFEVHWHIIWPISPDRCVASAFTPALEGLWARARAEDLGSVRALVLCPEDLVLHLCLHMAYHSFRFGPRALYDLAVTLRHYGQEIDWSQVRSRAGEWGLGRCVYLVLVLAHELLGAAVPDGALAALQPNSLQPWVLDWAREQVLASPDAGLPPLHNVVRVGEAAGLGKVLTLLRIVFPSPRVLAALYSLPASSWRLYFYYPVRVRDLVRKYGRVSRQLLRGDRELLAAAESASRANALWDWLTAA
jgi:hypothetical protein